MNVNHITLDMMHSYANACRELHDTVEVLRLDGYDLLVVPSRGAHPFLQGANSYAHRLNSDIDNTSRQLLILSIEEVYLPFTADIGDDIQIVPAEVRSYWTRILAAIIRRDTNDVAYRLYRYLRKLAGIADFDMTTVRGGLSGKFIFVDTVQSGQAICDIFEAFDRYGLSHCHFILLIDNNGNDIKNRYRSKINSMIYTGRATAINVTNIFTEDEGPAMSGIWTVTFPEIMVLAKERIPELHSSGETAASFYYVEVSKRKDESNLAITLSNAKLSVLLFTLINGQDDLASIFLEQFKEHIRKEKLQDQNVTKRIADSKICQAIPLARTDVSGSHVVRAYLHAGKAESTVMDFLKS